MCSWSTDSGRTAFQLNVKEVRKRPFMCKRECSLWNRHGLGWGRDTACGENPHHTPILDLEPSIMTNSTLFYPALFPPTVLDKTDQTDNIRHNTHKRPGTVTKSYIN
ncbi:hypothetical protein AMECASPLE_029435 [Ameca splendens]|uniref:Uncharacterized protein n=1 Tax=Ameca splendens TaxID=208324 RepID=A0ABV0YHH3_9TELE